MTSTTLPRFNIAGLTAIDVGQGPPVVLLHGVGLQADACAPQIDAFRATHRVIAPDMLGHGQSPRPKGPMALGDYARATRCLLDALPEPALVIGHSMGAMIALDLASRAPDKVCGVVALNGIFARTDEAAQAVRTRADALTGVSTPDPTATLERWFGTTPSTARTDCEAWLRAADPLGYKLAYTAFAYADGPSPQALQSIRCPALFATGALEPNSTPDMSQAMAQHTADGRALIIKGAAHMMPLTHAAQVNTALLDFEHQLERR